MSHPNDLKADATAVIRFPVLSDGMLYELGQATPNSLGSVVRRHLSNSHVREAIY